MRPTDWFNILDVDEWRTDRTRFAADRPVIGRHSRGDRAKWPVDPAEILAAYPDDDALRVEILGGADPAVRALGRRPRNWTVHPFGSMTPRDFLRRIDFFVYYHHPGWIEAFGRNVIEAMASGCPVILPAHFESTFGDGAHYAQPAGVRTIVERLYDDPAGLPGAIGRRARARGAQLRRPGPRAAPARADRRPERPAGAPAAAPATTHAPRLHRCGGGGIGDAAAARGRAVARGRRAGAAAGRARSGARRRGGRAVRAPAAGRRRDGAGDHAAGSTRSRAGMPRRR